jgi:hypothetical protein
MAGSAAAVSTTNAPPRPIDTDRRSEPRETYVTPAKLAESISRIFESSITSKTLANWRSAGKGPAFVKMGRFVRYDLREVNRWFEAQRRTGKLGKRKLP